MSRAAAALLSLLVLTGCSREEATALLKDDLPANTIDIIHARFPCRSPTCTSSAIDSASK